MKIGLDLDGVSADFQGGWARMYKQWFDAEIDPSKLGNWDAFIEATHFETPAKFWQWTDISNLWESLDPIPGFQGGVEMLNEFGCSIQIVTSRHANARMGTMEWLKRYWPIGRRFPIVQFTPNKGAVDVQILVDDSPEVLKALHEAGRPVIKFEQPWNKNVKGVQSVSNWHDLTMALLSAKEALA
jgi:5'(3')-deoxyribonucleotidase